jgi:hypothetical protein
MATPTKKTPVKAMTLPAVRRGWTRTGDEGHKVSFESRRFGHKIGESRFDFSWTWRGIL